LTTTHAVARPRAASAEHFFFAGMSAAILVAVCGGFLRTFFFRRWFPELRSASEPFFALHGMVFVGWFTLLLVQSVLVGQGRVALHRGLGALGSVLATTMVILGVTGTVIAARRPEGFISVPVPPLQFMATPFVDLVLFAALVGTALVLRRDHQSHKRLMLIGSIAILSSAIARWPVEFLDAGPPAFFGVTDLFLVPLVVWDVLTLRRLHPATLWGGGVLVVSQPLRLAVSGTEAWLSFARWMTALPG
jgi:uncharacterized membrane protein YozB (DUF420 family)